MGHERVELHTVTGLRRYRRWRGGRLNTHTERYVELGQMPDDERWYARHTGKGAAFVFTAERDACELVQRWLSRGQWHPIPACYDARGMPADGRQWHAVGQTWKPGPAPADG